MTALQPQTTSFDTDAADGTPAPVIRRLTLGGSTSVDPSSSTTGIGHEGTLLRRLEPTLRMWEEIWGARWVTSRGGTQYDVFIPTSRYVAPDGTHLLHVCVAAPTPTSVALRLPELITVPACGREATAAFAGCAPALSSGARYALDAAGLASVSLDVSDATHANFELMQFLGHLRGTMDANFHQLLAARVAAARGDQR